MVFLFYILTLKIWRKKKNYWFDCEWIEAPHKCFVPQMWIKVHEFRIALVACFNLSHVNWIYNFSNEKEKIEIRKKEHKSDENRYKMWRTEGKIKKKKKQVRPCLLVGMRRIMKTILCYRCFTAKKSVFFFHGTHCFINTFVCETEEIDCGISLRHQFSISFSHYY